MIIIAPSYMYLQMVLAAVVAVRAAGNDGLASWHASCYYIPGSRAFYTVRSRSQQVPNITLLLCSFLGVEMIITFTPQSYIANKLYQEGSHQLNSFPVHLLPGNHGWGFS